MSIVILFWKSNKIGMLFCFCEEIMNDELLLWKIIALGIEITKQYYNTEKF